MKLCSIIFGCPRQFAEPLQQLGTDTGHHSASLGDNIEEACNMAFFNWSEAYLIPICLWLANMKTINQSSMCCQVRRSKDYRLQQHESADTTLPKILCLFQCPSICISRAKHCIECSNLQVGLSHPGVCCQVSRSEDYRLQQHESADTTLPQDLNNIPCQ